MERVVPLKLDEALETEMNDLNHKNGQVGKEA